MRLLGLVLFLFGVVTLLVYFLEFDAPWLAWVGNWGDNVAWAIRGGATVLGLVLMTAGGKKDGKKK